MDIRTVAVLAISLAVCILAAWGRSLLRQIQAKVDSDRMAMHNAVQLLRSGVDQNRQDAEALGKRLGAIATKADEAHATIATLAERFAVFADDQGETAVMQRPNPLTAPAALSTTTRNKLDSLAETPPPTRRDRQNGEVKQEQSPPSGRTLAGVGPEAERIRKAVIAIQESTP